MEHQFWRDRWSKGEIGFHRGEVNASLLRHFDVIRGRKRILVPLCGRSVDLFWLRDQGFQVVGVELVASAVSGLFADAGVTPERAQVDGFEVFETEGIAVWVGDWFAASPALLGRFDTVWDRAALVAVGPERFERYAATERALLEEGGVVLLSTLVRPDEVGPPWSVPEDLVRGLFVGASVTRLHEGRDDARPEWQELVFHVMP